MSRRAFTLVELLVVISIIGLLSTIAVISLNQARLKGYDAKRTADIKQIMTAMTLYYQDNGAFPNTGPTGLNCAAGAGGWYCLGHGTAGTCWQGTDHGCTALDNALTPYMAKIPDDPINNTAFQGDAYMYNLNAFGVGSLTGPALVWGYSEPTSANVCFGGTFGTYDASANRYWCAANLPQ